MPRGVYDRSKSKSKTEKTAAPKSDAKIEKKARAPYGSKKAAAAQTYTAPRVVVQSSGFGLAELASIRGAFTGNLPNHNIVGKLDTLILKEIDSLLGTEVSAPVESKRAVQAPAPVQAAAPIPAAAPFNPAVPPNGQA